MIDDSFQVVGVSTGINGNILTAEQMKKLVQGMFMDSLNTQHKSVIMPDVAENQVSNLEVKKNASAKKRCRPRKNQTIK